MVDINVGETDSPRVKSLKVQLLQALQEEQPTTIN